VAVAKTGRGWGGPRYRRRRPLPAVLVFALLVVLAIFMWTRVFETTANTEAATECNLPGEPKVPPAGPDRTTAPAVAPFGSMLPRDSLDHVTPAAPKNVRVTVLNANGQSRQATLIGDELNGFGFAQGGPPANDPIYPRFDMKCHGQIRFGGPGASAARTLSLAVPCAQLVQDGRPDPSVDLALGSEFNDIKMTRQAKQVLQQLTAWAARPGQAAGSPPPVIDTNLLSEARDVHC
jgi:hypothetical protein